MTKSEFLDELCRALRFCPSAEEVQRTVNFYAEAIDDRMEDGMSEEEAVAAMGSVEDIVRELKSTWQKEEDSAPAGESVRPGKVTRVFSPDSVSRIEVFDTSGSIDILPSPDGQIHIEYTASDTWRYDITGESVVTVRRVKNGEWGKTLTLGLFGRDFTVPIPNFNGAFKELYLRLLLPASGGPAVNVNSVSGDVECRNVSPAQLYVKLASGDVTLAYARMEGKLSVITVSGDVDLTEVSAPEAAVSTVSGGVDIEDLNAAELDLKTVSGDIDAGAIAATRRLTAGSVSGDIDLALTVPCERLGIDSVSGDVELALPGSDTLYTLTTKTNTGDVEISGHRCAGPNQVRVKTMSGDITVSFG